MLAPLLRPALVAGVLALPVFGQILPGHSIAAVRVTNQPGEMWDIDHVTGTATPLVISGALANDQPNCVLMTSLVTGFVGTTPATTGNIYAITVSGNTVVETQLNTTATVGANIAQLALVNNRVYFCSQNAGALGALQSVPDNGGPVTLDLDLASLGATGLANACAAIGSKVYVATFNSSPANTATSPGELFEYDTVTMTGSLVLNLPPGGFAPNGNAWNTGIVKMQEDPQTPGQLVLEGVYGDLMHIDPVSGTVVSQVWTGVLNAGGNALASGSVDSFAFDPVAQDWIVGTRSGTIERWVEGVQADAKITIGAANGRVSGLYYFPVSTTAADTSYGPGCAGNEGWTPTDSSFGAPIAGTTTFRFGLFSANPGDLAVLLVDFQNVVLGGVLLPADMGSLGAPGCFVRSGNLLSTFVVTSGTGAGNGQVTVPLSLPAWTTGISFFRQWAELQATPTNGLGIVMSNARLLTVQ